MRKKFHATSSGFTLIEILLYLSLSIVMIVLISGIGANTLSSYVSQSAESDLQYNARFLTERLQEFIHEAETIEQPVAAATSSMLLLRTNDIETDPTVIQIVDGRLEVTRGTHEPVLLSGSGVVVSDVEFFNLTPDGGAGTVRTVTRLNLYNPNNLMSLKASTTVYSTVNILYP